MDARNLLLCKAKRLDNKEWVAGWYTGFSLQGDTPCIMPIEGNPRTFVPIDENTLCLNTMIKDINGRQLFSDDIVECLGHKGHIKVVANSYGAWTFFITWYNDGRAVGRQPLSEIRYETDAAWAYLGNAQDSREVLTERMS